MSERLLRQNIYGTERDPWIGPFGLMVGQMYAERGFGHNSGWYNYQGERTGWGDLSSEDVRRIRDEIPEGEAFITVKEGDAFWHFTTKKGDIGSLAETRDKIDKPGIGYVAQVARFIVQRGTVYEVEQEDRIWYDVEVRGISRQDAVNMLIPPSER